MTAIFISYSRKERDLVSGIVADLEDIGHQVWFDRELTGGHDWWQTILENIRACELFVFAMSHGSLESYPCSLEYKYAHALGKRILPLLIADANVELLPTELSKIQFIDYRQADKTATKALARSLGSLPAAQPLPDPLPVPPSAPVSQLTKIIERVAAPELSFQEQTALVFELKQLLDNPDDEVSANALLKRLRKHPDLRASVEREISEILDTPKPAQPTAKVNVQVNKVKPAPQRLPTVQKELKTSPDSNSARLSRRIVLRRSAMILLRFMSIVIAMIIFMLNTSGEGASRAILNIYEANYNNISGTTELRILIGTLVLAAGIVVAIELARRLQIANRIIRISIAWNLSLLVVIPMIFNNVNSAVALHALIIMAGFAIAAGLTRKVGFSIFIAGISFVLGALLKNSIYTSDNYYFTPSLTIPAAALTSIGAFLPELITMVWRRVKARQLEPTSEVIGDT
jgi:hypothetical protein